MTKAKLNVKEARIFITNQREGGKSDEEIYSELKSQYLDPEKLSNLISNTVTQENKEQYELYNSTLLVLIGIAILVKLVTFYNFAMNEGTSGVIIFIVLVPIIFLYFLYEIYNYRGNAYRLLGAYCILVVLQSFLKVENIYDAIIYIGLYGTISGFSFYLDKYMFPKFSPQNIEEISDDEVDSMENN